MSTLAEKVAAEIQRWYRIGYEQGKEDAVVHGRWIVFNDGTPEFPQRDHMKCSICGWYWSIPEHRKVFIRCPKCGAKMDAQEGENNG